MKGSRPMALDAFSEAELPLGYLTTSSISDCRRYRYTWCRHWEPEKGAVVFIMLNPSTADEIDEDPTIRRCLGFARAWGFGELRVGNLFAFRSQDPGRLKQVADPVGQENDHYLLYLVKGAKLVVAAWGTMGGYKGRDKQVRALLPGMAVLSLCKNGQPGHPLYLPKVAEPVEWRGS